MCNPWDPRCATDSCDEEPVQKEEIELYPSDDGKMVVKSDTVLVFKPYTHSCLDVAKYILDKTRTMTCDDGHIGWGPTPTIKMHRLLYYCQAWSLVWDGEKLFKEKIRAWINGPAIDEFYEICRNGTDRTSYFELCSSNKIFEKCCEIKDKKQCETIDRVIEYYGSKNSDALNDLAQSEYPWKEARKGLAPNERGNNEIKLVDMLEYYSSIPPNVP